MVTITRSSSEKYKMLMLEFYESGIPLSMRTVANYACFNKDIEDNVDFKIVDYKANSDALGIIKDRATLEEIKDTIREYEPDALCFSIWLWNFKQVEIVSQLIKNEFPNVKIILGGLGIFYPEKFLNKNKQFDVYCYERQGEKTFENIIFSLLGDKELSTIPGIYYWESDELKQTPKEFPKIEPDKLIGVWDRFPPPDMQALGDAGEDINLAYEVLRGCVYKCPYCAWGAEIEKVFYKEEDAIIAEINRLPDNTSLEIIDSISNSSKHLYILKNIKKTFSKLVLTVDQRMFPKGTDEFISVLKEFPSLLIGMGIQSFDPKVTKAIKRNIRYDIITKWSEAFKDDPNVVLDLQFILGLPHQTYKIAKEDIDLGQKLGSVSVSPLIVLPQSDFWTNSKDWGAIYTKDYPYKFIESDYLSKEEVDELVEFYKRDSTINYNP